MIKSLGSETRWSILMHVMNQLSQNTQVNVFFALLPLEFSVYPLPKSHLRLNALNWNKCFFYKQKTNNIFVLESTKVDSK